MLYISADDIVIIHDAIINEIGGSFGIREPGLLLSIAEKPKANFNGQELYPDIFVKAAALYEGLCNYHVFVDGNKRTAVIAMYRFLIINGYMLLANNKAVEEYTLYIVNNKPEITEITNWIKKHSRKVKK